MKLSESQKQKGYFENPNMSEFRSNIGKWLDLVAKDGWIKIWNRSRPNMILITEEEFTKISEKAEKHESTNNK